MHHEQRHSRRTRDRIPTHPSNRCQIVPPGVSLGISSSHERGSTGAERPLEMSPAARNEQDAGPGVVPILPDVG